MKNEITLLEKLLDAAKKDTKGIELLKTCAVRCQQFELAVILREYEKSLPYVQAHDLGVKISNALGMIGMSISTKDSWIIYNTIKMYEQKRNAFSVDDATEIKFNAEKLFKKPDTTP